MWGTPMRDAKDVSVERASVDDGAKIADLYLASRADALPFLRRVHPDDEVRCWIQTVLLCRGETWVARLDGHVVGFLTLIGDDLDQLYLRPGVDGCTDPRKSGAECLNWWADIGRREALAERHVCDCWIGDGVLSGAMRRCGAFAA